MIHLSAEETGDLEPRSVEFEANRCFNCGCIAVNSSDIAPILIVLNATIKTSKRLIRPNIFLSRELINHHT